MKPEIHSRSGVLPRPEPPAGADYGVRPTPERPVAPDSAQRGRRRRAATSASIRIVRRFDAPAEHVFHAWLAPDIARQWLFATAARPVAHVDIDARVTGSFRFTERRDDRTLEHCGDYVEIVPHRRLVFTLRMSDAPSVVTRVSVDIAARKRGCELTLAHANVPAQHAIRTRQRWTGILYGLRLTLDSSAAPSATHT